MTVEVGTQKVWAYGTDTVLGYRAVIRGMGEYGQPTHVPAIQYPAGKLYDSPEQAMNAWEACESHVAIGDRPFHPGVTAEINEQGLLRL